MILVTLGTQDKEFPRLLEAVEQAIIKGVIQEEVVVQKGTTKYESRYMKMYDFFTQEEFDSWMDQCDILITHGGVGSILTGLNHHKKVIAAARLSKYKEHVNDHQLQIIENFAKEKYILALKDFSKLGVLLEKAKEFHPKKFVSNTSHMIDLIENYIDGI